MENTHPFLRGGIMITNTEKSLSKMDGHRNKKLLHDRIAMENHSYVAIGAERIRLSNH